MGELLLGKLGHSPLVQIVSHWGGLGGPYPTPMMASENQKKTKKDLDHMLGGLQWSEVPMESFSGADQQSL